MDDERYTINEMGGSSLPAQNSSNQPVPFTPPPAMINTSLPDPGQGVRFDISSPIRPEDIGLQITPEVKCYSNVNEDLHEQGYDSDGLRAPWLGISSNGYEEQMLEEDPLPEKNDDNGAPQDSSAPLSSGPPSVLSPEIIDKMMVSNLRAALKARSLSTKGLKQELVSRLKEAVRNNVPVTVQDPEQGTKTSSAGDVFDNSAYWKLLDADGEEIVENESHLHAPTVPEGEKSRVKKRNYLTTFDRPIFSGKAELPIRYNDGRLAKDREGNFKYEIRPTEETVPNMEFCRENGLTLLSDPVDWFEAFVPIKNKRQDNNNAFTIENLLSWTNQKAMLQNAGKIGGKYPDFVPFLLDEFKKHIALYLFQGLSPSPKVEQKFESSHLDPVNGSDFIHKVFGGQTGRSIRRHKHFKCFFASVNPNVPTPSRETNPNFKVEPIIKHKIKISKRAVFLGANLSCDEQTIGFQGKHKDKQRITYKREGDGFLADCICSDGYTFTFFFRHVKASEKFLKMASPLHARVMALCSQLPDRHYTLGMDNLYMSTKICRLLYSMSAKVMAHGVTRPSLRGIPSCIKQNEVTRKKELEDVRHTVKAAKLTGDSICSDLVAISLYDTKPVYFLSNVCKEIKWIEKTKKVHDEAQQKYINMKFHRLEVIDFYNYNMGNVDVADQLRNAYRYDTVWHRNRKWWWSIWWWAFQGLLTNSYILYIKFHRIHDSKNAMSHYDYIKSVTLAWLEPGTYRQKTTTSSSARKRKHKDDEPGGVRTRSSESTISTITTNESSRQTKITNTSLHPSTGSLRCRLNTTVQHLPMKSKNQKPRCQLHSWARGGNAPKVMSGVVTCQICQVDLCLDCYRLFHTEAHPDTMRCTFIRTN